MSSNHTQLLSIVTNIGNRDIDWPAIEAVFPEHLDMLKTEQDRFYHSEGNVWIHTKMVCEALVANVVYQAMDQAGRTRMFLAALLHDLAKPSTTKVYGDNRISSKGHSQRGEVDARVLLWRAGYGFAERESVCRMIRYHQEPFLALKKDNVRFLAHKWSHEVVLKELALLAESDARGRRTDPPSDWQNTIDNVELFREFAKEEGCYEKPRFMADSHTAIAYFRRDGQISGDFSFYQKEGSSVILMSGLPASGKDTWLSKNHPSLPVVSIDDAMAELDLVHGENNGKAAHFAIEKAKGFLRKGEPFAWNATNISPLLRKKALDLLYAYDARVTIQYLEQPESVLMSRNHKRDTTLSNKGILGMLNRWEVPYPTEADAVLYPA